jgi:hypothetical protein
VFIFLLRSTRIHSTIHSSSCVAVCPARSFYQRSCLNVHGDRWAFIDDRGEPQFSRFIFLLLELSCAAILLTHLVVAKIATNSSRTNESEPILLRFLLAVVVYAATRIVWTLKFGMAGGNDVWGDPAVFLAAVSSLVCPNARRC